MLFKHFSENKIKTENWDKHKSKNYERNFYLMFLKNIYYYYYLQILKQIKLDFAPGRVIKGNCSIQFKSNY